MKKKALLLGLAAALVISQSALGLAAGSYSNGSGGGSGSGGGASHSDMTSSSTTSTTTTGGVTTGTTAAGVTTSTAADGTTVATVTEGTAGAITAALSTGAVINAQPTVAVDSATIAEKTSAFAGVTISVSTNFASYGENGAMAIATVNANPATLVNLPAAPGTDLNSVTMLTLFQKLENVPANPVAGSCVAISVPSITAESKVFLLYIDPATNMTVKIPAAGVDLATGTVLVDASLTGAFSVVVEK